MTAYTDALEAWNRQCHSDALREMQIVPAEEMQPETIVGVHVGWVVPMAFLLAITLVVIWA
ncbi:hypothetical protein [Sphingopyxis witflariensis]|uniref:Uncharacterized protein n=1 Tax=Sphingopyxis witflariensis TaxID=173675 RepID=A0A246JZM2_9SPHN|nr:hypothetical protein [Sphingopyxis witflariensis]OWQ97986.1 hypothetical protein CDQ91_10220 [Sphingopyxis witflariensis]